MSYSFYCGYIPVFSCVLLAIFRLVCLLGTLTSKAASLIEAVLEGFKEEKQLTFYLKYKFFSRLNVSLLQAVLFIKTSERVQKSTRHCIP